jgi:hypothetical protein
VRHQGGGPPISSNRLVQPLKLSKRRRTVCVELGRLRMGSNAALGHRQGRLRLSRQQRNLPESEDGLKMVRLDLQHAAVQLAGFVEQPGLLPLPRKTEGFLYRRIERRR